MMNLYREGSGAAGVFYWPLAICGKHTTLLSIIIIKIETYLWLYLSKIPTLIPTLIPTFYYAEVGILFLKNSYFSKRIPTST